LRSGLGWSVLPPRVEAEIVGTADVGKNVFRTVAEEANDCLAVYYSVGACVSNSDKEGEAVLRHLKHDEMSYACGCVCDDRSRRIGQTNNQRKH
jgi:hypothetical protein